MLRLVQLSLLCMTPQLGKGVIKKKCTVDGKVFNAIHGTGLLCGPFPDSRESDPFQTDGIHKAMADGWCFTLHTPQFDQP